MKASYLEGLDQLAFDAPEVSEGDIEDAMELPRLDAQPSQDDDEMMEGPPDEDQDHIEAMFASYEEQRAQASNRPRSPTMSDDDYDDIFAELIAQESQRPQASSTDQMDTTGDDSVMSF